MPSSFRQARCMKLKLRLQRPGVVLQFWALNAHTESQVLPLGLNSCTTGGCKQKGSGLYWKVCTLLLLMGQVPSQFPGTLASALLPKREWGSNDNNKHLSGVYHVPSPVLYICVLLYVIPTTIFGVMVISIISPFLQMRIVKVQERKRQSLVPADFLDNQYTPLPHIPFPLFWNSTDMGCVCVMGCQRALSPHLPPQCRRQG